MAGTYTDRGTVAESSFPVSDTYQAKRIDSAFIDVQKASGGGTGRKWMNRAFDSNLGEIVIWITTGDLPDKAYTNLPAGHAAVDMTDYVHMDATSAP